MDWSLRHLGALPFGFRRGVTSEKRMVIWVASGHCLRADTLRYSSEIHRKRVSVRIDGRNIVLLLLFVMLVLHGGRRGAGAESALAWGRAWLLRT
jgi:hypothetical protein